MFCQIRKAPNIVRSFCLTVGVSGEILQRIDSTAVYSDFKVNVGACGIAC